MPKNLKDIIDNVEAEESETAKLEEKIERLTELVEKQKKIISEQTEVLDQQKLRLSKMVDVPDDIRELRDIIGTQRGQINEREIELEHTKGLLVQAQKELELTKNRMKPQAMKLEATLETIGKLKAEIAQKNSELQVKNETLQAFTNKLKEAQAVSKELENERTILIEQMEQKTDVEFKKQIENLKTDHSKEKQQLKARITELEGELLDQKLEFEEQITEARGMKDRYETLIQKVEDLNEKNRIANEEINSLNKKLEEQVASITEEKDAIIKSLNAKMADLKEFRKENYPKLAVLEKLKPLMERDPLFKAYFIIEQVKSITLDDLKSAVGSPIVVVKRDVETLEKQGLVEMNDAQKIIIKTQE
ncbi:MAG: hypothetical protein GF353_01305 [Candidatus Lokiarchaeota archaeon]|nr:hypothetical protein [Candidatus Lokiarchaeota archaeon]